ncbi:hypothetical protein [Evansella tamaricis]|uniref:Uncharacterized protein n=1 Tax=Evansella tamaricis TaxID=2069301 RepID=A0ABS6JJH3_9BACI|nr:hypothetical protein [Evansella tamaricis]MBU9713834.1 hypothetical protein [Evansella tamaricis]
MKLLWLILTLVPAPFLFHFFEYGQHIAIEPPFLFLGSMLYVVITGVLAGKIKIRYMILVNMIAGILSLLLAMYFIPDDGAWFKPLSRDLVIIITAIVFSVGQLLVSLLSRKKTY